MNITGTLSAIPEPYEVIIDNIFRFKIISFYENEIKGFEGGKEYIKRVENFTVKFTTNPNDIDTLLRFQFYINTFQNDKILLSFKILSKSNQLVAKKASIKYINYYNNSIEICFKPNKYTIKEVKTTKSIINNKNDDRIINR